ncbi:MAG: SufD family Fe-S cluster assembly protein, partial [Acetobacteraceae bacterium]|nr:SufD family Fe-S cluster assembly protein [Acetobacteraceae bacterium]
MNAASQSGTTAFLARFEGLKERLPGKRAAREAAAAALRASGLPTIRDEAWKYTNLRPIAEASFHEPLTTLAGGSELLAHLPVLDAPRVVFVDGRYLEDLSVLPETVTVESFAEEPDFGTLARPDREPLVALNTMLAEDGAIISVDDGIDAGLLQLISLGTDVPGRPVAFHPRHKVRVGRAARLMLLEMSAGEGTYLHNPVAEMHVERGAVLTHVRLQEESPSAYHLSTLYAQIAERGTYDSFALVFGGRVTRTEAHARLSGEHGATHLNGAQLLGG